MNKYKSDEWNIEDIAAQCVMPRLDIGRYVNEDDYNTEIKQLAADGIGGFCIFSGGLKDTQRAIAELQMNAKIPLIFSADFEYGLPMRLTNGTEFPHAMALGKAGRPDRTAAVAKAIAKEAIALGVNWNLAPVCDVNSNVENPIINIRSFGEKRDVVEKHLVEYIKASQEQKALACAKHFPGHGDTSVDSHLELPVLKHDRERIESLELRPFKKAIKAGVKSIMTGHLSVPALDESGLPASLSKPIITGILKEELGYNGLILTDALDMKAISDNYPGGKAAVMALSAGNDIALLPENPREAIEALIHEAEKDDGFKHQLIFSANKLLREKKLAGLYSWRASDMDVKYYFSEHEKIALEAAFGAVKISGLQRNIPLPEDKKIAGFAFIQGEDMKPGTLFFNFLAQATQNDCQFGFIDQNISDKDVADFKKEIEEAEIILFAFFIRAKAYAGSVALPDNIKKAMAELSEGKSSISVFMGSPYISDEIESDALIYTYTDALPGIAAAIMKLSGREPGGENKVGLN